MPKKKNNSLVDILNTAGGKNQPVSNDETTKVNYESVKARAGKRMVAGYFAADVHRNLKMLAAQYDLTLQDIVTQAISDYLKSHGFPPLQEDKNK